MSHIAYRARWRKKSENFPSKEAAVDWARRHEGAKAAYYNGVRWIDIPLTPDTQGISPAESPSGGSGPA